MLTWFHIVGFLLIPILILQMLVEIKVGSRFNKNRRSARIGAALIFKGWVRKSWWERMALLIYLWNPLLTFVLGVVTIIVVMAMYMTNI